MTDVPDFDEIAEADESESSSTESRESKDRDDRMYIKGRYGTKEVRRDEGCQVCRRHADILLLVGAIPEDEEQTYDKLVLVCEDHEGDVRGDLEYGPNLIQRREF